MFQCKVTQAQNPYWFTLWLWSRCISRSVRLQDLDFDRKQLKVVQGKGKKDRYVPLSIHLIRGLQNTSKPKTPRLPFNGQPLANGTGDFDNRYS
jgi:hypothetical protein